VGAVTILSTTYFVYKFIEEPLFLHDFFNRSGPISNITQSFPDGIAVESNNQ